MRSGAKTMPAYIFASVEITDPAAYEEYRRRVPAMVAPSNAWKAMRR